MEEDCVVCPRASRTLGPRVWLRTFNFKERCVCVCVCVCTSLAHEIRGSQPFDLLKHVCTCLPK